MLKNVILKFIHLGTTDEQSLIDKNTTILLNLLYIFAILTSVPFGFITFFQGEILGFYRVIFGVFGMAIGLVLNIKRHHIAAKYMINMMGAILIMTDDLHYGGRTGFFIIFINIMCGTFVMFHKHERKHHIINIIFIFLCGVTTAIFSDEFSLDGTSLEKDGFIASYYWSAFFISFCMILIQVWNYSVTLTKLVDESSEKKKYFQSIVNGIPDGLFLVNKEEQIIEWKDPNGKIDLSEKHPYTDKYIKDVYSNKIVKTMSLKIAKALEEDRQQDFEFQDLETKNCPFYDCRVVPVSATRAFCIVRDVTQRKSYENALINARKKAEEATLAKAQFLSIMSHEIRTPLNAVIGISHLLLDNSPKEEQLENLETLQFSSESLLSIINNILDYNKIEAEKISLEKTEYNLPALFHSLVRTMDYKAKEGNIQIELEIHEDIPESLIGDPTRLAQIANNLIGNAVKFTTNGTVKIIINILKDNETCIALDFRIIDTGIGIPSTVGEKIFEQFSQANSDTTRKYGGTGLGLAITQKLLELQGSCLGMSSTEGEGTMFFFTLTLKKNLNAIPFIKLTEENINEIIENKTVLLVEDNPVNTMVGKQFLQQWKMIVDTAINGQEAVSMANEKPYDLILMDLQMPVLDGFDATKQIRASDSINSKTPIIALSASSMIEVKEKALDLGMNDYVAKPFNPVELKSAISQQLQLLIAIG